MEQDRAFLSVHAIQKKAARTKGANVSRKKLNVTVNVIGVNLVPINMIKNYFCQNKFKI